MNSISPSFFYEHSFAIHFAVVLLAAASSFVLVKLVTLIAYVSKSIATKIRAANLGSIGSARHVAVGQ